MCDEYYEIVYLKNNRDNVKDNEYYPCLARGGMGQIYIKIKHEDCDKIVEFEPSSAPKFLSVITGDQNLIEKNWGEALAWCKRENRKTEETIKIEMPVEFDNLVNLLRDSNYEVTVIYNSKPEKHDREAHWTAEVFSGMRLAYCEELYQIKAMFCTETDWVHEALSGKIAADCYDCFDKWRRCPIVLPFPKTGIRKGFCWIN